MRRMPGDLLTTCNFGRLLAELGEQEEAQRLLNRADHLLAVSSRLPAADRRALEANVNDFRRELSAHEP